MVGKQEYLGEAGIAALAAIFVVLILSIIFRSQIRRFYIRAAELLILFVCVVFVIWSGIVGAAVAQTYGPMLGLRGELRIAGLLAGTFAGFTISAILAATFFLLVEIAENSRKTVLFFERASGRAQRREPEL